LSVNTGPKPVHSPEQKSTTDRCGNLKA